MGCAERGKFCAGSGKDWTGMFCASKDMVFAVRVWAVLTMGALVGHG
jgi:hypothetical protein